MQIAIVGAGAVGLTLGARLARAGSQVHFLVRRAEVAQALEREGVAVADVVGGTSWEVKEGISASVLDAQRALGVSLVVFCTRAEDLEPAADAVCRSTPRARVVSAQNGIASERLLGDSFQRVAGLVYRQTVSRTSARSVNMGGAGRVVVGPWGAGWAEDAAVLDGFVSALRDAGYDVGESPDIVADKRLKLCLNLMSTPNALVRRSEHTSAAFVEVKARLLEEARDVLGAAGLAAHSGDGGDRSLDEEIDFQRSALQEGRSARPLPLYNAVWSALKHGAALEADVYHRTICELAAQHELSAPVNARCLEVLLAASAAGRGPESCGADELLPRSLQSLQSPPSLGPPSSSRSD